MTPQDNPFHTVNWPRSIAYPEEGGDAEALRLSWDLGAVDDKEKKKVVQAWVKKLPTLKQLKRLNLWVQVNQAVFDAACTLPNLEVLQIKWSSMQDIGAISNLSRLKALYIGSSTRVKSIEPLATLPTLEMLELENFKLISDFSPLTKLKTLQSLAVTGSMWSRQAVGSLEPFAAMTWLSHLALDTSSVSSLKPLSGLTGLKTLGLGGRLPFEEYAWLSAKLPHTECQRFEPYFELSSMGYSACKSCRKDSMVMLTGKGKSVLCKDCDAAKLAQHVDKFLAARAAALAE